MQTNHRRRRGIGPLQRWRAEYAYVSRELRRIKLLRDKPHLDPHQGYVGWGSFKHVAMQRAVHVLRQQARDLLARRPEAQKEAARLWAENSWDLSSHEHNEGLRQLGEGLREKDMRVYAGTGELERSGYASSDEEHDHLARAAHDMDDSTRGDPPFG